MDEFKTDKRGKVHFENSELSGIRIEFYAVPHDDNPNLFGVRVVLPPSVEARIDYAKMESGEHPDGHYTMGQMMEVLVVLCRQAQLHPHCVEVTNFDGTKHDVSDIGMEDVLKHIMAEMGQGMEERYNQEKEAGIIPDGLSFEDWLEFNSLTPNGETH